MLIGETAIFATSITRDQHLEWNLKEQSVSSIEPLEKIWEMERVKVVNVKKDRYAVQEIEYNSKRLRRTRTPNQCNNR